MDRLLGSVVLVLIFGFAAYLYEDAANRPILDARSVEIRPTAPYDRLVLRELRSDERAIEVRHSILHDHGDCYTLAWVCQTDQVDLFRTEMGRRLLAPTCGPHPLELNNGDVRVWSITLSANGELHTETIFQRIGGGTDRVPALGLPLCAYGGMPEGL